MGRGLVQELAAIVGGDKDEYRHLPLMLLFEMKMEIWW